MADMHEAVTSAVEVINDAYRDEGIEFDDEDWLITLEFTRQKVRKALGGLALPTRTLKIVKIGRRTGRFTGMKIRNPGA